MSEPRISTRKWEAILYPENMIENWENLIEEIIPLPMSYCIHDKDPHIDKITGEVTNKTHVHLIIVYSNTTTKSNIIKLCNKLSLPDKKCCSTAEEVINMQYAWDYLIHNTEKARKDNKYQYSSDKRHDLNNFDIHFLATDDEYEKNLKIMQLSDLILQKKLTNYVDFINIVLNDYDVSYFTIQKTNHSYFDTIIKGNYKKYVKKEEKKTP